MGGSAYENRRFLALCAVAIIVLFGFAVPRRGTSAHFDHFAFARTVELMDRGENYYDAYRDSFSEIRDPPSQARDVRPPLAFLLWRIIPFDQLYLAYLVLVVGVTSALLLFVTRYPVTVLAVTVFLLVAGRLPGSPTTEEWLLAELWAVPLIAGSLLAWKLKRWWWAAVLAGLAAFTRELTLPVMAMGLVLAWRRGLPIRPWVVCGATTVVGLIIHFAVAAQHTVATGHEAALLGSGHGFLSVLHMLNMTLPDPPVLGLVLWVIALRRLWHQPDRWLLWPLALLPLAGFIVERPYWGLLFEPFAVLLAAEAGVELALR